MKWTLWENPGRVLQCTLEVSAKDSQITQLAYLSRKQGKPNTHHDKSIQPVILWSRLHRNNLTVSHGKAGNEIWTLFTETWLNGQRFVLPSTNPQRLIPAQFPCVSYATALSVTWGYILNYLPLNVLVQRLAISCLWDVLDSNFNSHQPPQTMIRGYGSCIS